MVIHDDSTMLSGYDGADKATGTPRGLLLTCTTPNVGATAYTAVSVRQGFSQPYIQSQYSAYASPTNPPPPSAAAASPQQEAPQQQQKVDWPDSVRSYVQRSFESKNMLPDVTRDEMEAKLKETISHAKETGIMYTTNWDAMPLPQHLIKAQRVAQVMAPVWSSPAATAATAASLSGQSPAAAAQPTTTTTGSKKRKSGDFGDEPSPWRSTKNLSLSDRISHPPQAESKSQKQKQAEKRQKRFENEYRSAYRSPSPPPSTGPIVGTCTKLEKGYLRLTSAPKPSMVRPEHILHQTLDLLKKKWRQESNYNYICDQFKSLRQDLTVQRIRNEFTVSVYEIHARIALEKGDLGEYNQCQTQLRALYALGLKGNAVEFKAYRILYFIHTANRTALNDAIADLTTADKEERAIKHALEVRSALALGNHHRFFQLYLDVPNMGAYLIDMFVKRERLAALATMCKA